eukprot:1148073-Pelagomonas_calceolata.AAC.1
MCGHRPAPSLACPRRSSPASAIGDASQQPSMHVGQRSTAHHQAFSFLPSSCLTPTFLMPHLAPPLFSLVLPQTCFPLVSPHSSFLPSSCLTSYLPPLPRSSISPLAVLLSSPFCLAPPYPHSQFSYLPPFASLLHITTRSSPILPLCLAPPCPHSQFCTYTTSQLVHSTYWLTWPALLPAAPAAPARVRTAAAIPSNLEVHEQAVVILRP